MKGKKIQILSVLTRTDYNALRNYFMYQKKPVRTRFMVLTLLCSFLLLIVSGTAFSMSFFRPLGLLGVIIVTLIYCWISFEVRKLEQNVKDMIQKTQELALDDSGLTAKWSASGNEVHYEWVAFESAVETDPYFFLFLEKDYAIILPKIEQKDRLINEVREMISAHITLVSELSGFKAEV